MTGADLNKKISEELIEAAEKMLSSTLGMRVTRAEAHRFCEELVKGLKERIRK